jgi:hypothetical protein
MRKTVLALVATAGLMVAAGTLLPNATPMAVAVAKCEASRGYPNPNSRMSYPMKGCPEGPVECGLIVW